MKKRIENRGMFYGANAYLFSKAKELRNNPTDAERLLWQEINKSKLGVRFKMQHPLSRWIVDFYCHPLKLVIELDGGYHENKEQKEKDEGRSHEINKFGIKILRFTNEEIEHNVLKVMDRIKSEMENIKP